MMSKPLHIWITGAGSGIGSALALRLGVNTRLSVSGRRSTLLDDLAERCGADRVQVCSCDVADASSVAQAHRMAVERFGPVDVLVNNAGIAEFAELAATPMDDFEQQIDVNLLGAIRCTKEVLPSMIERKRGMILSVNSVAATTTFPGCAAYAASKAGLLAAMRSLRAEVRQHGIKVIDVLLGATATPIWSPEMLHENSNRMIDAGDVAAELVHLISMIDAPQMLIEELTIRPQFGDL
jgi:short-subunit dehydrogenase